MLKLPKNLYQDIDFATYKLEKKRLQLEMLNLQQCIIENNKRLAIVFEGRDAAGKGSTIKRLVENLIPKYLRVVELDVPTPYEMKNWFARYKKRMPKPGQIVFFDRSWYGRALVQPTMGYCTKQQYKYFMDNVIEWENNLIDEGVTLIKFYLSVNNKTQLLRFKKRQTDPLTHWKYSENDHKIRDKWDIFTNYKDQMLERTSTTSSPWVIINSNNKFSTRLNVMYYIVNNLFYDNKKEFIPLDKEIIAGDMNIELDGIVFNRLNLLQYKVLERYKNLGSNNE
jgi:polyphosphate kinase 2